MTNEMELENKKEEIRMPWQSKILVFLYLLNLLFLSQILLPLKISRKFFSMYSENVMDYFFTKNYFFAFLFAIKWGWFFVFLNLFILISFIKGKKYLFIFILFLEITFIFICFLESFSSDFFKFFVFDIFILYLSISCLMHPFYNQKKIKI